MEHALTGHEVPASPVSAKHQTAWRTLPAVGLAGCCAAAALADVPEGEGAILCPFRLLTGLWCPGCGGTRALRHLMHGDVSMSLTLNPFLLIVLAQAVAISAAFASAPARTRQWFRTNDLRLLQANIAVGVTIWLVRIATGEIPIPFGG